MNDRCFGALRRAKFGIIFFFELLGIYCPIEPFVFVGYSRIDSGFGSSGGAEVKAAHGNMDQGNAFIPGTPGGPRVIPTP